MVDPRLTDPRATAALGEKIYAERYRAEFEKLYLGQFVVIDVATGEAYRGRSPEEALRTAKERVPDGVFHMIRIGETGAFRVSYSSRVASRNRLST